VVEVKVSDPVAAVEVRSFRESGGGLLEILEIESFVEPPIETALDGLVDRAADAEREESSNDEGDLRMKRGSQSGL
jgi:hypothetical protein